GRHLSELQLARGVGEPPFVIAVAPAVHQDNRKRVDASLARLLQRGVRRLLIQSDQYLAVDAYAFVDLYDPLVEHRRKHDLAREYLGTRLVADPQRVAEAARDRERDPLALPFEQGIGGDGGTHAHLADRPALVREHAPDRFERGVLIMAGVLGQQLFDAKQAIRRPRYDIGEGAAAVDCEGP